MPHGEEITAPHRQGSEACKKLPCVTSNNLALEGCPCAKAASTTIADREGHTDLMVLSNSGEDCQDTCFGRECIRP